MAVINNPVSLRLMTKDDLPMLHGWLSHPHVVQWWGDAEDISTLDSLLTDEKVTPYIAMLGTRAIGFAQSYIALGSGDGWWENETDPGMRGIDQFLAYPTDLNRGFGTQLVRALVRQLFSDLAVTKIQTDPAPTNLRAIRCYEKAGFVQGDVITTPDGLALYMIQTRHDFNARLK